MQITEIKTIAKQHGVKVSKLKKAELIKHDPVGRRTLRLFCHSCR